MHRFYLPAEQWRGSSLELTEPECHHAVDVLRVCPGEQVCVLDGVGGEATCEIEKSARDRVALKVLNKRSVPYPATAITLVQAIPRGKLLEAVIQKATELGVSRIVPLLSERVVTHLDGTQLSRKQAKWQTVAVEAIKQCGNAWLPQVELPQTIAAFLERKEGFELPLIASLQANSEHPRKYFESFRREHGRDPGSVCIWIGPEGDFTGDEVAAIEQSGARPITLGPLVLRTETAAIYCLSVINYEVQASGRGR
jgi:16S rRNA (uracil1498-N3)-methyltransferase